MNTLNDLYNNINSIIQLYIKNIIITICTELDQKDKIPYFTNKYLKTSNNSYTFFINDIKPKLLKKFPNDTNEQITKRLNKLWNTLKPIHKKKYIKMESSQQYVSKCNSSSEKIVNSSISEDTSNIITKAESSNSSS